MKILLSLMTCLVTLANASEWKSQTRAVGYLMEWRGALPSQERIEGLTHLIITGFSLDTLQLDGSLDTSAHSNPEKEWDIDDLVAMGKLGGTKIMIMLGGWGSDKGFAEAAATPEARLKLANNLVNYCQAHGLAGVDFDWEFPENATQFADYELLMQVTRTEFDKVDLLLTSAIGTRHYDSFTEATYTYLDWINIMAYDEHWTQSGRSMGGNHAPTHIQEKHYPQWESVGVPRDKLVLGVPFYGRLTENWADARSYSDIFNSYGPESSHNLAGGYNFNGPHTIYNKASYAVENGYGGVMIWEIEQDLPLTHESSLHKALIQGIENGLAGTGVEREVLLDVDLDKTSALIAPSSFMASHYSVRDGLISNHSDQTINYQAYTLDGTLYQKGTLQGFESHPLDPSQLMPLFVNVQQ